ncbi:hypothetical protein F442_09468 [Phytophthora nicotianae P10297]|uniref:Uncharacterized protein n=3 Tax=Phytophthora nicotianae TaxID=4792 RepID=V9DSL4_PHYNI|nr:hypothetical protein F443_23232 [Phytophthora nicotianae P1569]ETM45823.1 hypothetical protein L914_09220 [Phytophthora nicotianae]ETP43884.1 hypothetical protein F442_09468 [Phytophthora nicotianae P10297]
MECRAKLRRRGALTCRDLMHLGQRHLQKQKPRQSRVHSRDHRAVGAKPTFRCDETGGSDYAVAPALPSVSPSSRGDMQDFTCLSERGLRGLQCEEQRCKQHSKRCGRSLPSSHLKVDLVIFGNIGNIGGFSQNR